MNMKVLVVGGGGREHAIARALARNPDVALYAFFSSPNPGILGLSRDTRIGSETDVEQVVRAASGWGVDIAVIGPEAPLEQGVVDGLEGAGIPCVGPTRAAARLETDKGFCRELMVEHGVAGCPRYRAFNDESEAETFLRSQNDNMVIKPIGLTGGKGVRIMGEHVDRRGAIDYVRHLHGRVIIEERLVGEEFTLQAFVDGEHVVFMPLVQDHKRAYEGDTGPNTGGMGSYSLPDHRLPFVTESEYRAARSIMEDAAAAMKRNGTPYRGILYGQFMNTAEGPKVVEFNARFGDPEAMNVLSILDRDLLGIFCRMIDGTLTGTSIAFAPLATVCKYLVPEGYPEAPVSDQPVSVPEGGRAMMYCANVVKRDGRLYTGRSRTMACVGIGGTLDEAEQIAEESASQVNGRVFHRRDIGTPEVLSRRIRHMQELR
ncbi:MAG: phosphoribosylamine--glycine ligase [Methanomicrobiales archaeon]